MSGVPGLDLALLGVAAFGGGAVNALAGGGTLITFPALVASGLTPLAANITNTVAMAPGYLGAAIAQRDDVRAEKAWLRRAIPASILGGAAGAALLLGTGERAFAAATPWLILLAAALLAVQEPIRRGLLLRRADAGAPTEPVSPLPHAAGLALIAATAVYSGYFGAGASVIVLAVVGLMLDRSLPRLNGVKQALALAANLAAVAVVSLSGQVAWRAAIVMAIAAIAGGAVGARTAARMKPTLLRIAVVAVGVVVGIFYLVRGT